MTRKTGRAVNLTSLIMKGLAPRARAFERATRDPIKAQERVLLKYLSRNARTEYASKYNFSAIRSIKDFRRRLPLSDYTAIKPYIDRMKKGASGVLTADKVKFFGTTSGSTGEPKFIPATKYSQARKSDLMDIWAYYLAKDHPKVFDGRILGIVSPEIKDYTDAGIAYGPEDGHAYNNLPEIIKRRYALPYELFYINNYDARYYCILRIAIEHNITTIATLNPGTLTLLCQKIPALQDRIIDDIERGTLDESLDIIPDIRRTIEGTLRPNPRRAGELKALLNEKGELLPKDFWAHLDLIECWKGGMVKSYLSRLPDYFGNVAVRDFGCLATEARSSIPMSDAGAGGVLAVQTNFYEFIPREDMDKAQKRILLCDELEPGREYLLIVTTAGGLYRYNIDDIICVKGFFNKTPIIEFMQKGHNVISITGEKMCESHIEEAVIGSAAKHQVRIRSFSASAVMGDTPRYVLLVEFEGTPSQGEKRGLLLSIEKALRLQNSEYDDLRKQQLIAFPSMRVISPGEFERYKMARLKDGAHDTQFKMPRLVLSGGFLENFIVTEEIFAPS